jgi:hypothetical protein
MSGGPALVAGSGSGLPGGRLHGFVLFVAFASGWTLEIYRGSQKMKSGRTHTSAPPASHPHPCTPPLPPIPSHHHTTLSALPQPTTHTPRFPVLPCPCPSRPDPPRKRPPTLLNPTPHPHPPSAAPGPPAPTPPPLHPPPHFQARRILRNHSVRYRYFVSPFLRTRACLLASPLDHIPSKRTEGFQDRGLPTTRFRPEKG